LIIDVSPTRLIAFTVMPAEGSEPANFGLCCYPATVQDHEGRKLRTHLSGWSWRSFCKTQYASNPELGGVENFLKCHLLLIRLLDHANELGLLGEVSDESNYWENRDAEALAKTVGEWNTMIAGFVGRMKDQLGGRLDGGPVGREVQSEITKFPDFEHLEAKGRAGEDEAKGNNPTFRKIDARGARESDLIQAVPRAVDDEATGRCKSSRQFIMGPLRPMNYKVALQEQP
jgi:hypothetical protein